jgi:hypothetical protein
MPAPVVRGAKVGRNDLCHCGSGKKFKKCCEAKEYRAGWGGRLLIVALVGSVIGAILLAAGSFNQASSSAPARQVWSPEHGHYHAVP